MIHVPSRRSHAIGIPLRYCGSSILDWRTGLASTGGLVPCRWQSRTGHGFYRCRFPSEWGPLSIGERWHETLALGADLLIRAAFLQMLAYALSGYTEGSPPRTSSLPEKTRPILQAIISPLSAGAAPYRHT